MNFFLKIVSIILFFGALLLLVQQPSTESFIIFFVCFIIMLAYVYNEKISAYSRKKEETDILDRNCMITEFSFHFKKGYYFKHGYLNNKKDLLFSDVNEIWINTFPLVAIVNKSEVIFLRGIKKEDLNFVVGLANIPLKEVQDNWSLLCDKYLDTEFDQEYKEKSLSKLINAGFTHQDIKKIKKIIGWRMMLLTFLTWEWIHYSHYDVLKQFHF
jgi:hypothetical protein